MLKVKKASLSPLIKSQDGVHLTVYLNNSAADLDQTKKNLNEVIRDTEDRLLEIYDKEKCEKFLEPVRKNMLDDNFLNKLKGNIGVFRNEKLFRVLQIPVQVKPSSQLATSFHVKPLLKWLQQDQDFLILGIDDESAHLYLGSQYHFKKIDTLLFDENNKAANQVLVLNWLNDFLLEMKSHSCPKLFVVGDKGKIKHIMSHLSYKNLSKKNINEEFKKNDVLQYCNQIRKILKIELNYNYEKALSQFKLNFGSHRVQKNIFQITKAVVKGRVKKIIVTDEIQIFGKIDKTTGGLALHPFEIDHEDDCVLDDLAQMVLNQGGEVVIAKRSDIPKGRPILAILDDDENIYNMQNAPKYFLEDRP